MDTPPVTPRSKSGPPSAPRKARPIHLILDFDGTITQEDTTTVLADVACDRLARSPEDKWDHCKLWETCCQKYFSEVHNHPSIKALKEKRTTIDEEVWFQRSVRVVEEASVSRVGQSRIFRGVPARAWRESGWRECQSKRVKITTGFRTLVERVQDQGGRWGIVSVNWSQDFLKGVLGFALGGDRKADSVPVLSNRVIGETGFIVGPRFGPGPRSGPAMRTQPVCASGTRVEAWSFRQLQTLNEEKLLLSCDDKLEAMKSLRDSFQGSTRNRNRTFLQSIGNRFGIVSDEKPLIPLVMFVGDSMTDIECLLEADIGIVMSFKGTGNLMETLGRYNISVIHISFWEPQPGKSIWFARDFQDIINCRLFTESATQSSRHQPRNYIERWLRNTHHKVY